MKNQIIELPATTFTGLANRYGRPSPAFFVHRYYLTPAQCETYEAGRHMVRTYDDGLNLVLKLVSRV